MVNRNHGRTPNQQASPLMIKPRWRHESEKLLPITTWSSRNIDTTPVNKQLYMPLKAKLLFKLTLFPPILEGSQDMELIKTARECDILQTLNNVGGICYLWTILQDQRETTRNGLFFRRRNRIYVDISRQVTKQNSTAAIPVHSTFYLTTNSEKPVNANSGILQLVTLTVHRYELKTFRSWTGRPGVSVLAQNKRRKRWQKEAKLEKLSWWKEERNTNLKKRWNVKELSILSTNENNEENEKAIFIFHLNLPTPSLNITRTVNTRKSYRHW